MMRMSARLVAVVVCVGACGSGGSGGGPPTGGGPTTGTISGQVVDADSANGGVANVTIQATGPGGAAATATTSATGAYTVPNAAPGGWQLAVQVPATHQLAAGEAGTRPVTVTVGQTATATAFNLARPKGSVTGSATSSGTAVAGGTVVASRTGFASRNTAPTATGYTIANLPVGAWSLGYTPPATHVLATGETGTRAVTITSGGTATPAAFLLNPAPPAPVVVDVHLTASTFSPASITIEPGTTVRWINDAVMQHTVTPENASQPGSWTSQTANTAGVVFEHTFTEAAQVYRYRCELHSADFTGGMVGMITVN